MQNFMKPIINAIKYWTNSKIEESKTVLNEKISNSKADWTENNSNSDSYIKNRPFYTSDPVETTLVEEQAITIDENMGSGVIISACPLKPEQEYIVTLDGSTYNCVGKMHEEFDMPYIGNVGLINAGEDTGESFFIAPMQSETELRVIIIGDILEHVISITGMISEIHPLEEKYLPKEYATADDIRDVQIYIDNVKTMATVQSDWNEGNTSSNAYIKNKPNIDALSARIDNNSANLLTLENHQLSLPVADHWDTICYGNKTFVVVPNGIYSNKIACSKDGGLSWTATNNIEELNSYVDNSIIYYKNEFRLYCGYYCFHSQDGINWESNELPITVRNISCNQEKMVCTCEYNGYSNSAIAYSSDGNQWTSAYSNSSIDYFQTVYGNNKFVAVGKHRNTNKLVFSYSEDGVTWTANFSQFTHNINDAAITYGENGFVVVVSSNALTNKFYYSADGINWIQATLPLSARWGSIAYGNGKFVAIAQSIQSGQSNIAIYSNDGINWNETTLPTFAYWCSVTYGDNKFIAINNVNNNICHSEDGTVWTNHVYTNFFQNNQNVTTVIKELLLDSYATEEYVDNAMAEVDISGVVKYDESQDLTDEQKTQARENISALGYNWHTIDNNLGVMFASLGSDFIPNWKNGLNVESTDTYYENALSEFVKNLYTLMRRTQYSDSFAKNVVNSGFRLIDAGVLLDDTTYFFACVANSNDINNPNKIAFVSVKHQSTRSRWQLTDTSAWNALRTALINDDGTLYQQTLDYTDTSLTKNGLPADAKVTGEALATKITSPTTAAIGQTIVVKSVDENNKPTEWECTTIEGTDSAIPDWAKQPEKPTYTPDEIGAQPAGNYLTEDNLSGYATEEYVDNFFEGTIKYNEVQNLTAEEIEQARQNIHSAGVMTAGLEMRPFTVTAVEDYHNWTVEYGDPIVAAEGAEVYGDYIYNVATGAWSRASGAGTQALGDFSDASGWLTQATAFCSIASGRQTTASGPYSHAEGHLTKALKNDSHAEGEGSIANGARAHAEGYFTQANSNQAHSEGMNTIASGVNSHAEGWATTASGENAVSSGKNTLASGAESFANGLNTIAEGAQQTVHGKFNIKDTISSMIVGNGSADTARSNAFTLDGAGNAWFSGDVYIKSTSGVNKDEGSKKLATEEYVDTQISSLQETVTPTALILASPNGTKFTITVDNNGILTATEVVD